jgi:hypothetical protein
MTETSGIPELTETQERVLRDLCGFEGGVEKTVAHALGAPRTFRRLIELGLAEETEEQYKPTARGFEVAASLGLVETSDVPEEDETICEKCGGSYPYEYVEHGEPCPHCGWVRGQSEEE